MTLCFQLIFVLINAIMSSSSSSEESDSSSDINRNEKTKFFADASNHDFFVNKDKEVNKNRENRYDKHLQTQKDDGTNLDNYQKHLAKQLSEVLDKRIKYLEKDLHVSSETPPFCSSNIDQIRLFENSNTFVRESSPEKVSVKQKRPKIKKRKVDSSSEDSSSEETRSKRLASVAVSGFSLLKKMKE